MDPRLDKIGRFGPVTAYHVDGDAIRDTVDPDFTNYGQHFRFDFVPEFEWWIDKEYAGDETLDYLIGLDVEWSAMRDGASYADALDKATAEVERVRHLTSKGPSKVDGASADKLEGLRIKQLDTVNIGDTTVEIWLVHGKLVRDRFDSNWTEGGHGLVYDWQPNDEIWIDDDQSEYNRQKSIRHETHEYGDMQQGMPYNQAHVRALQAERDPSESVVASLITRVREGAAPGDVVDELTTAAGVQGLPAPMLVPDKKDATTKPGYPLIKTTRKDDGKSRTGETAYDPNNHESVDEAEARDVAGAIYDYLGYVTSRPETKKVGSSESPTPMLDDLTKWAAERGLDIEDANVENWQSTLSQAAADELMHPNGRCTCCGEGRCDWCIKTELAEYVQGGGLGGGGSQSDYHTGPWTFGVGGPDRGGHYRDLRAATRGGQDSPDQEPGSVPPPDWPDQWTQGAKKLNIAYNKDEVAIEAVLAGHSTSEALELVEASSWIAMDCKDIKTALKRSVQAVAVKRNWTVVKQSIDYALAISAWGPRREYKLVRQGGPLSAGVVMARTLEPNDSPER